MKHSDFDFVDFVYKLIFPPRCPVCSRVLGFVPQCERCTPLIPKLLRRELVPLAMHDLQMLKAAYAAFDYKPPMKKALLLAKYDGRRDSVRFFAQYMAQGVKDARWEVTLVVPVPSHPSSVEKRGHDTALLFAEALAPKLELPLGHDVLKKCYKTKEQHVLSAKARKTNLLGAFSVEDAESVRGQNILLVDDVLTTGATLNECAKMLLGAGAVCCYAVTATVSNGE